MDSANVTLQQSAGRYEGEHVAGRYRLTSLHRLDDRTEVWRAVDDGGQSVTLEFLRDRLPAARERFVEDARRTAAFQRPAVVQVAEIHDDDEVTFVAFAEMGSGSAATPSAPVPQAPPPTLAKPESVTTKTSPVHAAVVEPKPSAPLRPAPTRPDPPRVTAADRYGDSPNLHGLAGLKTVLRGCNLDLFETSMLREAAHELIAMARTWLSEHRVQERWESRVADVRTRIEHADYSVAWSALNLAADRARDFAAAPPRMRAPALPRLRVKLPSLARVSEADAVRARAIAPKSTQPRAPRAPRGPLFRVRIRWSRVLRRGMSLGVITATILLTPPEFAGRVWSQITPALDEGVRLASTMVEEGIRTAIATLDEKTKRATTPPTPALKPATFEVPPLSAYRAAFESQAPYPSARASGTVEWVVALRNTGAAGWYRGIDGAQASLALPDGTPVAVQSTPYVGPGEIGWFVVRFAAPSQPGTYTFSFVPRIDGRGQLQDLGIHAVVAVSPKQ